MHKILGMLALIAQVLWLAPVSAQITVEWLTTVPAPITVEWLAAPDWSKDGYWITTYVPDPLQRVRLKVGLQLPKELTLADCATLEDPRYPGEKVLHVFLSSKFVGGMCDPTQHKFWHADYPGGVCKQNNKAKVRVNFHVALPAYPRDVRVSDLDREEDLFGILPRAVPGIEPGTVFEGVGQAAAMLKWLGTKFPVNGEGAILAPTVFRVDSDWAFDDRGQVYAEPVYWDCRNELLQKK
jgi:hypothetical protein